MQMKTSIAGRNFIKRFELLKLRAYPDPATKDDPIKKGKPWTIGYGHTGPDVHEGLVISEMTAEKLFDHDIAIIEAGVNQLVKVELTQCQFDALVSFAFNCGLDIDEDTKAEGLGDSTLLKYVNAQKFDQAADEFRKWNHANGKVMAGLTIRCDCQRNMFLGRPV